MKLTKALVENIRQSLYWFALGINILGVLACASFVGSLIGDTIGTVTAVQIDGYARFAARWWVFLAIGAMIFAIVAGRRKIRRE